MRAPSSILIAATIVLASGGLHAATKHRTSSRTAALVGTPSCVYTTEQKAFEVEALKSQLMVTSLTCRGETHDRYNDFISHYHPELLGAEDTLRGYFKRSYGKAGSTQYDQYMTQLADNQEQIGLRAGTSYCSNLTSMYDEVMSLHDGSELHDYSNAKLLYLPTKLETCASEPATTASKSHSTRRSSKTRHSA